MPEPIVECIPNFSEGENLDIVNAIAEAIASVAGVLILDRTSDADHNRSVITFAGQPSAMIEAMFRGIQVASQQIDMDKHAGVHPCIGATDVVPFVPIQGISIEECVQLVHELGRRVGETLEIPVYLYESAATRPERVNLADVRKGGYQTLQNTIQNDPNRYPDYGPARLSKAGATVIGVRKPLIAFNVFLTTDDVSIAQKIAKTIRHSSGGLAYLKALGLLVNGRAQVSMNFTDYTQTGLAQAVEMIRREAQRYGVTIHHSELIGLAPQQALLDALQWYLQLDSLTSENVLEHQLQKLYRSSE